MIYKYLSEIKYRIFFSLLAWSFIMLNCYFFKEALLYVFIKLSLNQNYTNLLYFITTDVTEVFIVYIHLSYFVANQIIILFLGYQFFVFLSTGLYPFEYSYFKTIFVTITFCWISFIFIFNTFIFPASWFFFLEFQKFLSIQNLTFYFEAKLNEYITFYKSVYYLFNTIFYITIIFFAFLDLFKANLLILNKFRKTFYFFFFCFATFVTPPDVIYQLLTSICMVIIYELITIYIIFISELLKIK
jgi:sec-independent protein translocase protein TatC